MIDTPSPFTNAKLVSAHYDSREYVKQSAKRGDADYVMSRSDLMEFSKCPSRWRRGYREAEEGTDATEWGSLIDCLLFDNGRWSDRFAVKPETYPSEKEGDKPWNGNSKWCKNWMEEQGEKVCLKLEHYVEAKLAAARIKEDGTIEGILDSSDFQVYCTAEYKDRETGVVVPVKALIDIVPRDDRDEMQKAYDALPEIARSLIDFKTGKSANPAFWAREVHSRWYDAQAALFLDVYNAATREERIEFRHIVQESFPPYEISKPLLSAEFLELGRHKYSKALRLYAGCLKTNNWPSYDDLSQTNLGGWSLINPDAYMLSNL